MAVARKENFQDRDLQLSAWCKSLAHPARIVILKNLAKRKECICGELVIDLPLAQSTVSQHLKALKKAGLIQGEVDGPRSKYCIHRKNFEKFVKMFGEFSARVSDQLSDQMENQKC
jgi:DNA-binding transcriptional ArsR family regulator